MRTLVDAGPLVALIDRGQGGLHQTCVATLGSISALVTTWPCFTEAMYFLAGLRGWSGQRALWRFVHQGALQLHLPSDLEVERMYSLMAQYVDTYRINGVDAFENIP